MATPIIQTTGSVSGAGTPGAGRNNLVIGETVTLSDTAGNVGADYLWAMLDAPTGSGTIIVNPTNATPTFVPDVTGSYFIQATVNGTEVSSIIVAVPLANSGARIPAFNERVEYNAGGNTKGWHPDMTAFMRSLDTADAAAGVPSLRTLGTGATQAAAGNDARLTNDRTASGIRTATTVVDVHGATAPQPGQVLTATSDAAASWVTPVTLSSTGTKTGDYAANYNEVVPCDVTGGPLTVTLPAALNNGGKRVWIKKKDSTVNAVNVAKTGADTIDGAASYAMTGDKQAMIFVSDNVSDWMVF